MKRRHFFAISLSSALTPDIVLAGSDIVAHVQEPRYLGRTDAPIQVIEFFSMTCSHCASFHKKTFPEIKKHLIDSGMLRFEMRAFPLDGLSLRAHAMARVLSKEKYYPMVGMLLEKQTNWANAKDPTSHDDYIKQPPKYTNTKTLHWPIILSLRKYIGKPAYKQNM